MRPKITIVNASFFGGDKDIKGIVNQPEFENVDYKLFTNRPEVANDTIWNVKQIDTNTPRLKAREIKTLIHKFVPDSYIWFWLDSNMKVQTDPNLIVSHYLKHHDICLMPHPERNNWYEEAVMVMNGRDRKERVKEQVERYYDEGFMPTTLYETGCLLRRNIPKVQDFNETWWNEIKNGSIRDQLSFPYSLWKHGLSTNTFSGTNSVNQLRYKNKPYLPQWEDVIRDWN